MSVRMRGLSPAVVFAVALLTVAMFVSASLAQAEDSAGATRRLLYVAAPGIRNYLEFGGAGILVFDIDRDYAFVRRIDTPHSRAEKPDNVKGVCASAVTKRLYFTTPSKLYCVDLLNDKTHWETSPAGGCDRMSLTPDGKTLYFPSFEGPTWNVIDAEAGEIVSTLEPKSGAHNTVVSRDGRRMYLAGLKSPLLHVADTSTHTLLDPVGPFAAAIRPFTVSADRSRAYVNVNGLLGFEVGDLTTGKVLHRVEVEGVQAGAGEAAWLLQPRRGADSGRERSVGVRRRQQPPARFRQHGDAAEAEGEHCGPRTAGLDHVLARRPPRLAVDRRDRRHRHEADRRGAQG
ncbi:MAG: hypothetical protein IT428_14535 [Planctomycetaceae bacterium]|nr:hypothetical protein [Planctomycetaceae bacterium]